MRFFDTKATRRRLMAGGFTEEQADTAVTVAADVAGATLATKADLHSEIRDLEQRLTIRVGGMLTVAVAILVVCSPAEAAALGSLSVWAAAG